MSQRQRKDPETVITQLREMGVVPVVTLERAELAVRLAETLMTAGLPLVEITFRTSAAREAIQRVKVAFGNQMLVGAGTVLSKAQVDEAILAGADFIVAPGLNEEVVRFCQSEKICVLPGVATPSEMERAMALGLRAVKFFPAETLGGLRALKAMSAPYVGSAATLRFMPTGGINASSLREYISAKQVIACGGSWMVKSEDICAENWDTIEKLTRDAVDIVRSVRTSQH